MSKLLRISGRKLIKLLKKDGWQISDIKKHGIALFKKYPDGKTRVTTVKDTADSIPIGTLMAILSKKQTNLGREGLLKLINK